MFQVFIFFTSVQCFKLFVLFLLNVTVLLLCFDELGQFYTPVNNELVFFSSLSCSNSKTYNKYCIYKMLLHFSPDYFST